jgi:hypothetical protein
MCPKCGENPCVCIGGYHLQFSSVIGVADLPEVGEDNVIYTTQNGDGPFFFKDGEYHLIDESPEQKRTIVLPESLHTDTVDTIVKTTNALAEKLLNAQTKHNLVNGWKNPPVTGEMGKGRFFLTREHCVNAFIKHVNKGDHLDAIAYLMFMHDLGWSLPSIECTDSSPKVPNDTLPIDDIKE